MLSVVPQGAVRPVEPGVAGIEALADVVAAEPAVALLGRAVLSFVLLEVGLVHHLHLLDEPSETELTL